MRRAVRCAVLVSLALGCCAAFGALGATAGAVDGTTLTDPARAVVAAELGRDAASGANSVNSREAHIASRTAFRALSATEAQRALVEEHPRVVSEPGWLRPSLIAALADAEPLAPNLLRVKGTIGPDSVVLTSQPVAFHDADGALKEIDLGLRENGDGDLMPRRAPFRLSLPTSLDNGITVGDGGRRFSIFPDVSQGGDAVVEHYAAFYGNVDQDTDFIVKPVLGGVETFSILRSPASPELLRLRLRAGAGSVLLPSAVGGGYSLWRGAEELAAVSPAQAWDSEHRPVDVEASLQGDELLLRVEHRDRDVAYPIVVDPVVVDTCYAWADVRSGCQVDAWEGGTSTFNSGTAGWAYEGPADGRFAPYAGAGYLGSGLYVRNLANNYYWSGEAGDWYYRAPVGVRIWSALFDRLSQDNLGDNTSCLFVGVLENTGAWGRSSPRTFCAQQTLDQSFRWCPGTSCSDQSGGTPGNAAIFGAMAQRTGWSSYWMDHMGAVAIAMTEMSWASLNPYISSPDFPDTWQTERNNRITFHIGDAGLGIRSIAFSSPENPTWQAIDADTGGVASRTYSCFGGTRFACPMDVWIRMKLGNLRQGYSTIRAKVTDIVGKTYTYEHAIAIQYYWASVQYGGTNGVVDTYDEVTNVVNAMAATSASGRQALWAGLDQASRDYYIDDLLPTAREVRGDFALDSSDTATRSVFSDPTTHGTIAEYGAPMTSTELASIAESTSELTYDGSPDGDVLASSYSVSTDDGADVPDSTGNIGCDPSTETGCTDSSTSLTSTASIASDLTTDDLNATAGTTSSAAAVAAGAAKRRFDRYGARADADAHALTPRSGLYSPFGDSDCTNFVSQVWHLGGGLPMKLGWRIRFIRRGGAGARSSTRSWTLVRDFVDYMVNRRQTSRLVTADVTSSNLPATAAIADAIEYDWGEGEGWSHLSVVVKVNTNSDNISQHSIDRRQSPWNRGWVNQPVRSIRDRMRARIVHLRAP